MELEYTPALARALERLAPGDPKAIYKHFDEVVRRGTKLVIWAAESSPTNKSHLAEQVAAIEQAAKRKRAKVVGTVECVCSRYEDEPDNGWTAKLIEAYRVAAAHGAMIVATEPDRFASHWKSRPPKKKPGAPKWTRPPALASDLEVLRELADGILLATLAPPDVTPAAAIALRTKRGQVKPGGNKGGRPGLPGHRARRRDRMIAQARRLRGTGHSWSQVAALLKVARSTIRDWMKRPK